MTVRRIGAAAVAALWLAAGCGNEGGELKDATARRRAELAGRDTSGAPLDTSSVADTARLPAFAGDTPVRAPLRVDSARKDSVRADTTKAPAPAAEWTTGTRDGGKTGTLVTVRGVRASSNPAAGYDRLVVDFGAQPAPRWSARYADSPPRQCGSGAAATQQAAAWLVIRFNSTQAHDDAGIPTIRQRQSVLNMPVMKELDVTCDFEGEVELAIAVSAANPYHALELKNPSRLAIDVKQQP